LEIPLEVSDSIMALAWGAFDAIFPPVSEENVDENEETLRWDAFRDACTRTGIHIFQGITLVRRLCIYD